VATLFVVATPIGNLEDLSARSARVLREAPVVAAESISRTRGLLTHLGIRGKRLISCREANRQRAAQQVVEALNQGSAVALVTDAGTPGVSDPAAAVVQAAVQAGHRVSPVPGPSALAAALSVAGWQAAPFCFVGFLPAKQGPRRKLLAQAADLGWLLVAFEAPHRLAETARDLEEVLGDRPVVVCRELSKVNEEVVHTTCARLAREMQDQEVRGEITLVVAAGQPAPSDEAEVDRLLEEGLQAGQESPSRLAQRVARASGQPRDSVYRRLMQLKQTAQATRKEPVETSAIPETPEENQIERVMGVRNSLGLHARVAARIAETVQRYDCQVTLGKDGLEADAASVLSILTLDAPKGTELTVLAQGRQARQAMDALESLLASDFGES